MGGPPGRVARREAGGWAGSGLPISASLEVLPAARDGQSERMRGCAGLGVIPEGSVPLVPARPVRGLTRVVQRPAGGGAAGGSRTREAPENLRASVRVEPRPVFGDLGEPQGWAGAAVQPPHRLSRAQTRLCGAVAGGGGHRVAHTGFGQRGVQVAFPDGGGQPEQHRDLRLDGHRWWMVSIPTHGAPRPRLHARLSAFSTERLMTNPYSPHQV